MAELKRLFAILACMALVGCGAPPGAVGAGGAASPWVGRWKLVKVVPSSTNGTTLAMDFPGSIWNFYPDFGVTLQTETQTIDGPAEAMTTFNGYSATTMGHEGIRGSASYSGFGYWIPDNANSGSFMVTVRLHTNLEQENPTLLTQMMMQAYANNKQDTVFAIENTTGSGSARTCHLDGNESTWVYLGPPQGESPLAKAVDATGTHQSLSALGKQRTPEAHQKFNEVVASLFGEPMPTPEPAAQPIAQQPSPTPTTASAPEPAQQQQQEQASAPPIAPPVQVNMTTRTVQYQAKPRTIPEGLRVPPPAARSGSTIPGRLGITALDLPAGPTIVEVEGGGPCAGRLQQNDIILKVNGIYTRTVADVGVMSRTYHEGDIVPLTIQRGQRTGVVQIRLDGSY